MSELKSDITCANAEARLMEALTKAGIKMAPRYQTRSFARDHDFRSFGLQWFQHDGMAGIIKFIKEQQLPDGAMIEIRYVMRTHLGRIIYSTYPAVYLVAWMPSSQCKTSPPLPV